MTHAEPTRMKSGERSMENSTEQDPEQAENPLPDARLGRALLAGMRAIWDRVGLLLVVSVTWTVVLLLPLSLERWLPRHAPLAAHYAILLLAPVIAALPTAGVFAVAHRIASHDESFYSHLWQEGAALFGPALRLSLLQTLITGVLLTAIWFYLRVPFWPARVAVVVCAYAVLVWLMTLIYHWPVLVAQEKGLFDEPGKRAKRGALAAMRRSLFLALGRPFYTLGLLSVLLILSILMSLTLALPPLLWIGAVSLLSTFAVRALLVQFGVLPPPVQETPIPDEQYRLPT